MRLLVVRIDADAESEASVAWAAAQRWSVSSVRSGDALPGLAGVDAVWIHGDTLPVLGEQNATALRTWTEAGGGMVLSLLAAAAATGLGAPGPAPLQEKPRPWVHADDPLWTQPFRDWLDYPHIRGLQGWGAHPLFSGLRRGTYTWCAAEGERVSAAVFRKPGWPDEAAHVIAVERAYVRLDTDVAVAWEYKVGKGRMLCLGAHLRFTAPDDRLAVQRDTIFRNALEDAAHHTRVSSLRGHPGVSAAPESELAPRPHWPQARRKHAPVSVLPRPRALPPEIERTPLEPELHVSKPDASAFTLAGHRALVVGTEEGGVSEVWLHPMCVLSALEIRVGGARPSCNGVTAGAGDLTRTLSTSPDLIMQERIVVHPTRPEIHYQLVRSSAAPHERAEIEVTFRLPLRLEWPFPTDTLVPLRVETVSGTGRHVVAVTGRDGRHLSTVFVDGSEPPEVVAEEDEGSLIRLRSTDDQGIRLAVTAATTGRNGLVTPRSFADAVAAQRKRLTDLKQRTASLLTGDPVVDHAWPWAIARLSNFMAEGMDGRGVMAGHAASRPGWGRSRPGYAWFFGRDACWTADALLAVGMHNEARDAITLLIETADVTGKIAHEITTSGVVHYDAADATPLLLRAVATYAAWTGDLDQVRRWWPAVHRALSFCVSCDRDDDGLPENTGVGHGWVESGPLGGGAVTSYTASIWIDALRRLQPVARVLGDAAFEKRLAELEARAAIGFEGLRDPGSGRLALHRNHGGMLTTDLTALAAVPIALGVDTSPSTDDILEALGAPRFTAPWGLRMLPTDDPRYDAVSYHAGAVWPLFTGWAALADARRGAADRAFARIRATASLATQRCKGAFDEVLHGDTGAGAGICPDQAWSAAMLLAPVVNGLVGLEPDAVHGACRIAPRLPRGVSRLAVSGIRVGASRLSVVCQRSPEGHTVEVRLEADPANVHDLTVRLSNERVQLTAGAAAVLLNEGA